MATMEVFTILTIEKEEGVFVENYDNMYDAFESFNDLMDIHRFGMDHLQMAPFPKEGSLMARRSCENMTLELHVRKMFLNKE